MTAAPLDLISDFEAIAGHWHEVQLLMATAQFTEAAWSEHEAITMAAHTVLCIDGMKQLGSRCLLEGAVTTFL